MSQSGQSLPPKSPAVKLFKLNDFVFDKHPTVIKAETLAKLKYTTDHSGKYFYSGDAHANTLNLLGHAIVLGFVKLENESDFVDIYKMCRMTSPQEFIKMLYDDRENYKVTGKINVIDMNGEKVMMSPKDFIKIQTKNFEKYCRIMDKMQVIDKVSLLRSIGDNLADRGRGGDHHMIVFMLNLLKKGCNFKSKHSNHPLDFIAAVLLYNLEPSKYAIRLDKDYNLCNLEAYESEKNTANAEGYYFDTLTQLTGTTNKSLHDMGWMMEWGAISKEYIVDFTRNYYVPNYYLMEVFRDKDKGILVSATHASIIADEDREEDKDVPQDAVVIKDFFDSFGIRFDLTKPMNSNREKLLERTINVELNKAFQKKLLTGNKHAVLEMLKHAEGKPHPVNYIAWNREHFPVNVKNCIFGKHINGHDDGYINNPSESMVVINPSLGKGDLEPGSMLILAGSFSFTPFKDKSNDLTLSESEFDSPYKKNKKESKPTEAGLFSKVSASSNVTTRKSPRKKSMELQTTPSARLGHGVKGQ